MGIFAELPKFTFGEEYYDQYGRYDHVTYSAVSCVIVDEGELILYVDDQPRRVSQGEAALLYYHKSFMVLVSSNAPSRVRWCESKDPSSFFEVDDLVEKLPKVVASTQLRDIMNKGVDLSKSLEKKYSLELINSLGMTLLNYYLYLSQDALSEENIPKKIKRVKEYLDTYYPSPCDLQLLSEVSALTPSYLIKKFKEAYEVTPTKYLWHLRVNRGIEMLESTGLSITAIAEQCGFQNAHHFSRLVKQSFGYSPRDYRNALAVE